MSKNDKKVVIVEDKESPCVRKVKKKNTDTKSSV